MRAQGRREQRGQFYRTIRSLTRILGYFYNAAPFPLICWLGGFQRRVRDTNLREGRGERNPVTSVSDRHGVEPPKNRMAGLGAYPAECRSGGMADTHV
jgi:hypothetical protein